MDLTTGLSVCPIVEEKHTCDMAAVAGPQRYGMSSASLSGSYSHRLASTASSAAHVSVNFSSLCSVTDVTPQYVCCATVNLTSKRDET